MGFPNLKAEMARFGVKPADLAKVMGIKQDSIYPILNGHRSLTIRNATKIKKAFFPKANLEYLFEETPTDDRTA